MREKFSQQEWERVRLLPFLVYVMVAGADNVIDRKEKRQLLDAIERRHRVAEQAPDPLTAPEDVFENVAVAEIPALVERARAVARCREEVVLLRDLLRARLCEIDYDRVVSDLFALGVEIAQASGGFLGLGCRISDAEKRALETFGRTFDVHPRFLAAWARGNNGRFHAGP